MKAIHSIFFKGSFYSICSALLVGVFGYLSRRLMANSLPPDEYAFYYSFYAIVNFIIIFTQLGCADVILFELPGMIESGNNQKASNCYGFIKRFQAITSIIAVAGMLIAYPFLKNYYFNYPIKAENYIVFSLLILGFTFENTTLYALNTLTKFGTLSFLRAFKAGIFFLAILIMLHCSNPLPGIIISCVVITSICSFAGDLLSRHNTIFRKSEPIPDILKKQIVYSGGVFMLLGIGKIIFMDGGTIILSFFSTANEVVLFNIALPIAMIVQSMLIVLNVFAPLIANYCAQNNKQELKKMFCYLFAATAAGMLLWIPFYIFLGEWLITILFDEKFIAAKPATFFMVEAAMLTFPIHALMTMFNTAGMKHISIKVLFPTIISTLLFLPWLCGIYGAAGAGCGVFIVTVVWFTAYLIHFWRFIKA